MDIGKDRLTPASSSRCSAETIVESKRGIGAYSCGTDTQDMESLDTSDNACWLASNSLITIHNIHYQYLISDLENLLNFAHGYTVLRARHNQPL